jgi:hypothetical protein
VTYGAAVTGQKKLRGQTRHHLVGAPSWIGELGGIAPLFYSLPARPTDPENPKLIRKLPRDLSQMIGTPIPRMAFAYGALSASGFDLASKDGSAHAPRRSP